MAAGVLRICLLLLSIALLYRSAQSIRPLADTALLLPASTGQIGQRGLLSLVSDFQFASDVRIAAAASARRSLKKGTISLPPPTSAPSSPPPPVAAVPPPPGVSTNWVEEGY